jgi:galactitol-specific phosphotransferase system IIB component
MGAIGIKILEILRKLYGKEFVSKTIGTRANVVKPKELDTNAPTKNIYSTDAFRDPKLQNIVDEKIQEYAPFIFSNRNQREQMNFLENAEQLLKQKKRDFGVTDQLESVKKPKPEAEVVDIKTGKKAEGIETLKEDLGLPPEVDPKSQMGKALLESKRTFKAMDEEIDESDTLAKAVDAFFGTKNTARSFLEGRRRPIIRQILSEEDTIQKNLSEEAYDDLLFGRDLQGGADPDTDPFVYLNKYFVRDEDQLDMLDDIIDEMPRSTPAEISAEFKKRTGGLKPKEKDVGDKLKDLPDDIDPDAMAEGGRPGKGLDYLMGV